MKQYIFVLHELVSREVKRKYARSYLGVIWSVLNPLLSMVVLSMIFSTIFKRSIANFPVYYLTGSIMWSLFTGATNSSMTSLVDNRLMLERVKLPKQIFPLSRIFTALTNFGYSLIAYILILLFFMIVPTVTMLAFPVIVCFLLLFSIGIGYILSILNVYFGDIKHLYGVILTLWMYLSAIFYPVDRLSPFMQKIINANPIYAYIAAARRCVMEDQWPTRYEWIMMAVFGLGSFLLGTVVFNSNKNNIMARL